MKKILFPTDFSEAANNAFIYALNVANAINADIVTLHVYDLPRIKGAHMPHSLKEIYDSIEIEEFEYYRDALPLLHQIAEDNNLDNVQLTNLLIEGDTIKTIVKAAAKEEVDFIIMGTKGAGILKEIFFGSVASEVMEHAPCPVLAIPEKAKFDGLIDKIAISTDYSKKDVAAVREASQFSALFNASLHCLHVDTNHIEDIVHRMDEWKKNFVDTPMLQFKVIDGFDIFEELAKYLESNEIDIIAMIIEKRNFWQELLHFSKAKHMIIHHRFPVLSIPGHLLNTAEG